MTDLLDQRGVPASNVDASERVADNPAVAAGSSADNRFRTHQVANQVPPLDGYDPLACDPAVADALTREGAAEGATRVLPERESTQWAVRVRAAR